MKITALILLGIVVAAYTALYFIQEKLLFFPTPLPKQHDYEFPQSFKEINISAKDGTQLNCLHFNSLQAKGIVIYFHGNAGNLASWVFEASLYTQLNYDVFFVDYRSYGKSEGKIKSEEQLFF